MLGKRLCLISGFDLSITKARRDSTVFLYVILFLWQKSHTPPRLDWSEVKDLVLQTSSLVCTCAPTDSWKYSENSFSASGRIFVTRSLSCSLTTTVTFFSNKRTSPWTINSF